VEEASAGVGDLVEVAVRKDRRVLRVNRASKEIRASREQPGLVHRGTKAVLARRVPRVRLVQARRGPRVLRVQQGRRVR
jgi:hypothetical protein